MLSAEQYLLPINTIINDTLYEIRSSAANLKVFEAVQTYAALSHLCSSCGRTVHSIITR
jgi:uncharacterized OB-fold protein